MLLQNGLPSFLPLFGSGSPLGRPWSSVVPPDSSTVGVEVACSTPTVVKTPPAHEQKKKPPLYFNFNNPIF